MTVAAPDLVLVQLPSWGRRGPPFSLACLSASLKAAGFRTVCLDLNIELFHRLRGTPDEPLWRLNEGVWGDERRVPELMARHPAAMQDALDRILATGAPVIGFTTVWSTEVMNRRFAAALKQRAPEKVIVFGGPQCARDARGEALAARPEIDYVVTGEGEETLRELLTVLRAGGPVESVRGLLLRRDGAIRFTGERPLLANLDELPAPDFDDYDLTRYDPNDLLLPISTSRGCPNRCAYCDEKLFWHRFRSRSGDRIYRDVETLHRRYGVARFEFVDSLVNGDLPALERFCDLVIANRLPITWMGQATVRPEMDRALLKKIKDSGCFHLCFGMEHYATDLLVRMGKRLARGADPDRLIADCAAVGLGTGLNWMFGLPGQTAADFQADLDFFTRNREPLRVMSVNNSPGFCGFTSACYAARHPEEFGIVLGRDATTWQSADGTNTYLTRLHRYQTFTRQLDTLGIPHAFPVFPNEAELAADYHRGEGHYPAAIAGYLRSLFREGATTLKVKKAGVAVRDWARRCGS